MDGAAAALRSRRAWAALLLAAVGLLLPAGCADSAASGPAAAKPPASRPAARTLLYSDDFTHGLSNYAVELERGGSVRAAGGHLVVDVPRGCTIWLKRQFQGPVEIDYTATLISHGGPNDRVSDLNCFWMATDTRNPSDFFAVHRTGKFSDYDQLKTYYVGQGGNYNTTTRFRRYIGVKANRPLLPQYDLTAPQFLLTAGTPYHIRLIADGKHIAYWNNGKQIFAYTDPKPYKSGYFGFRTTFDHVEIGDFRVWRLKK